MVTKTITEQVQLISGEFNPLDASNLLNKLISEGLNTDKMERLKLMVGNENCNTTALDEHINYLTSEDKHLKQMIAEAQRSGRKVAINARLEITVE